jgi:uncharacterized membrane protein YdfJ with MMPL/SSD domain
VHLAGDIAINVDQQAKSGSTGNQVELLSVVFILVLLLLIFRSLLAPLATLIPAFMAVAVSGPLVGEAGAGWPEGLAARSADADRAGPRRGHRLWPLPRVPGP